MGKPKFHFNFLQNLHGELKETGFRFDTHNGIKTETQKTKFSKHRGGGSYNALRGGGGYSHKHNSSKNQLCIFKSKFRRDKALNKKNLDYIKREGKGYKGFDPELYGADPENYESRMVDLHFRFIISPDNQNVDITDLTKQAIKKLEDRTGYKLDWVGTDHYNTGKKHSHVIINGVDLNNNVVQFSREELSYFMRESCRQICTEMVGLRTPEERQLSYYNQTITNSFTQLDRRLDYLLNGKDSITFYNIHKLPDCTLFHRRMMHLKELDVVTFDPQTEHFTFGKDWKEQLRLYGKYNTYLEGLAFTKAHPSRYTLHDIDTLGAISGRVVRRYFMQENSNNHAVILETKPGHYVYVPLFEAPKDAVAGSDVKIDFQQLTTSSRKLRKTVNIQRLN